jgi:ectoine hydroxylase-related dioxygenase (phytanoyl-CoA dioxygenase family)
MNDERAVTAVDPAVLARLSTRPAAAITDQDVEAFERDGVVCLRRMFDEAWCGVLRDAALEAMAAGRGRVREPRLDPGQGRFYSSVYQSDHDTRFARLRDASPAPEIAARLMRADRVRFFYDQLFIKTPGTSAPTPWHNDLPFWPFRGNHLVSLWIALSPVGKETSGVQYVAGSHRWDRMFRAITPDYDARFMDPSMEVCPDYGAGAPEGLRVLCWDMQPGDVLCHHPLTVHGASGNASTSQTRIGLSVRYLGHDVRWDPRPHTMALRRTPAVAPGEFPADDEALPLVWERQRGLVAAAG